MTAILDVVRCGAVVGLEAPPVASEARPTTQEMCPAARPAVWEIHAADVARAGDFYREVFDWRFAPVERGLWGSVETQKQVGLDAAVSLTSGPPMLFPYVEVADLEATLAVVERQGGRVVLPPWQADAATRLALFTDPEGNRVGLIQRAW